MNMLRYIKFVKFFFTLCHWLSCFVTAQVIRFTVHSSRLVTWCIVRIGWIICSIRNGNLRQYALITRKHFVSVSLTLSSSQTLLSLSDKTLNPSYVTPQGQRHLFDQTGNFGGQRRRWTCERLRKKYQASPYLRFTTPFKTKATFQADSLTIVNQNK